MQIAFEASSITIDRPTGISNYGCSLVNEIHKLGKHDFDIHILYKVSRYRKRHSLYQPEWSTPHFYIPQLASSMPRLDVIHSLDSYLPAKCYSRSVVTIHDLFILTGKNGEFFEPHSIRRKKRYYDCVKKNADAIIAVSEKTKGDIIKCMGIPDNKIFVTPLGISTRYRPQSFETAREVHKKYDIACEYFLYVGDVSLKKNIPRLIKAFAVSGYSNDFQLVLCGSKNIQDHIIREEINRLNLNTRVLMLDYVDMDDLPGLYSGATGFLFPTLYEGFGLPLLEAMACETPVLTSTTGAAPEVCAGHGVLVDPYNVEHIADGIRRLLASTPDKLAAARQHANQYTWQRCAEQTINVYRSII